MRLAQRPHVLDLNIGLTRPSRRRTPAWIASLRGEVHAELLGAAPSAPHICRCTIGWDSGRLPLPSPIAAQTTKPLFITIHGLMPNDARGHSTRSASLPGAIEPTWSSMPTAIAGLIV